MKEKVPRAKIVRDVRQTNRKLTRKYNTLVDTSYSIQGIKVEKRAKKLKDSKQYDSDDELDIELYTTMHRVATQKIYDMIKEYLQRKGEIPPDAPVDLAQSN